MARHRKNPKPSQTKRAPSEARSGTWMKRISLCNNGQDDAFPYILQKLHAMRSNVTEFVRYIQRLPARFLSRMRLSDISGFVPKFLTNNMRRFARCEVCFFTDIKGARDRGGRIEFSHSIPNSSLSEVYVRDCYQVIESQLTQQTRKAIIEGTPGIGKSFFHIYLLWKFVREGRRVLCICHPFNIYYDGNGGVFQFSTGNLPPDTDYSFWNDSLWCLFDAKEQNAMSLGQLPYPVCRSIIFMSPRRELVNDYKKPPSPLRFYMPPWTKAELKNIAHLFPKSRTWRDRFKILGGIPRYVLEDTTQAPSEILRATCSLCTLNECISTVGLDSTITDKSKITHSLIHVLSTAPFTRSSVSFASAAARDTIIYQKGIEGRRRMRELLSSCAGNPLCASFCGGLFEPYAIEVLEKGGTFTCRKLVDGRSKTKPSSEEMVIPPSARIVVDRICSGTTPNQLFVPKTTNYTGLDAWMPGVGAFQMTVGKKHDI